MAENDTGQERTEDATSKRQEKAREEGQVARSRELNTLFILVAGMSGLMIYGPRLGTALSELMRFNLELSREVAFDSNQALTHLWHSVLSVGMVLLPLLTVRLSFKFLRKKFISADFEMVINLSIVV